MWRVAERYLQPDEDGKLGSTAETIWHSQLVCATPTHVHLLPIHRSLVLQLIRSGSYYCGLVSVMMLCRDGNTDEMSDAESTGLMMCARGGSRKLRKFLDFNRVVSNPPCIHAKASLLVHA